jgi:hypothetical protein
MKGVCVEQRPLPDVQRRPEQPQSSPSENQDAEDMLFRCVFWGREVEDAQKNKIFRCNMDERERYLWING